MRNPSLSELESEYRQYLVEVRALGPASAKDYVYSFRRFCDFLKTRRVRAARRVSLNLAYAFLEEFSRGRSRRTVRVMHARTRSILRFLHFARVLPRDLSRDMIAPRTWKLADVPQAFSRKDTVRVFANLRSETPYDLRERAMVLLFVCYGLRVGEVTGMDLDDIDWRRKIITIRQRKNRVPLILPLLPPVEEALREYVVHSRPPDVRSKRLFVAMSHRKKASLTRRLVAKIVAKFLHRCGLEGSANKFRHTLATRLINSGVRLEAVQAILGHRQLESTRIYAKIHWEALREVARNYSMFL